MKSVYIYICISQVEILCSPNCEWKVSYMQELFVELSCWSFHADFPARCGRCIAQAFITTEEFLPWLQVSNLGFQIMNHLSAGNSTADNKWLAVNQRFCSCNYGFGLSDLFRCDSKVLDTRYTINPKEMKSCWGRVNCVHSGETEQGLCITLFLSIDLNKIQRAHRSESCCAIRPRDEGEQNQALFADW